MFGLMSIEPMAPIGVHVAYMLAHYAGFRIPAPDKPHCVTRTDGRSAVTVAIPLSVVNCRDSLPVASWQMFSAVHESDRALKSDLLLLAASKKLISKFSQFYRLILA